MISRSRPGACRPFAVGSAALALLLSGLAAADSSPIDKASGQVSAALTALKDVKIGNKNGDEHLEKARAYLARARAELLKAQSQSTSE